MNQDLQESFLNDNYTHYSPETIRVYKIALRQFFSYKELKPEEVKARDIREWLAMMEVEGLTSRSIQTKLAALKSFFRYLMEEEVLVKSPLQNIGVPKKEDSLPYYLTNNRLALLRELTKKKPRDRAIVETLYATGVRISELLNIELNDINWDTRQIWIKKGKCNKERFVLFSNDCSQRLESYLLSRRNQSKYLFTNSRGEPLSRMTVQYNFRNYSRDLGFKVSPHTLRHTFAAHLAEKGMPYRYIQELLGHSGINSIRLYTRLMNHASQKLI